MTQTVQPRSLALSYETGKELIEDKDETEGGIGCLLSLCDSLNRLSKALNGMNNIHDRLCKKLIRLDGIIRNI